MSLTKSWFVRDSQITLPRCVRIRVAVAPPPLPEPCVCPVRPFATSSALV